MEHVMMYRNVYHRVHQLVITRQRYPATSRYPGSCLDKRSCHLLPHAVILMYRFKPSRANVQSQRKQDKRPHSASMSVGSSVTALVSTSASASASVHCQAASNPHSCVPMTRTKFSFTGSRRPAGLQTARHTATLQRKFATYRNEILSSVVQWQAHYHHHHHQFNTHECSMFSWWATFVHSIPTAIMLQRPRS